MLQLKSQGDDIEGELSSYLAQRDQEARDRQYCKSGTPKYVQTKQTAFCVIRWQSSSKTLQMEQASLQEQRKCSTNQIRHAKCEYQDEPDYP
jgi:hypothetical protein